MFSNSPVTTHPLNLPADLVAFLQQGAQLRYDHTRCECGHVTLLPLHKLAVGEVWIDPLRHTQRAIKPPSGGAVHYVLPAISLLASAEHYDAEYILCWLPTLGVFATADVEHGDVTTFPGITWTQIAADPLRFLDSQWSPPEARGGERLLPGPSLEERAGTHPPN